jgi:electron transport complex protein RnfA
MSTLAALAVFSGLSLNLTIQLGMGISDARSELVRPVKFTLVEWGVLFLSVLVLWCLFSFVFTPLALGFFEYFLLFPLAAGTGKVLKALILRLFPDDFSDSQLFSTVSAYNGLVVAALVITLRLAASFSQAAAMALGFSLGALLALSILKAVYNRSSMENVPRILRGIPLMFISMGLLALIFSSLSVIFLRLLGIY